MDRPKLIRRIIISALVCGYCALVGWSIWRYIVQGCDVAVVTNASCVAVGLAGLLTLAALGRQAWPALTLYAAAGFAVEQLGVHTGLPFGYYRYLGLGPHVFGVPPLVAVSWAVLLAYTSQMLTPLNLPRATTAAIGGAWMVLFDLAIDPLAAGPLKSWVWLQPGGYYGVPWGNFIGWFLLSFGLLYCTRPFTRKSTWVGFIGASIGLSALLGCLRLGYPAAALASAGLLALHLLVPRIAALRLAAARQVAPAEAAVVEFNIYRTPNNP